MTAAATTAATSSCSGRRQPRHGREACRARGGEQLVVNRPEALRHGREGRIHVGGSIGADGEEDERGGGGEWGRVLDVEIVLGVGHFQLESPGYDELVAWTVLNWLDKIPA